MTKENGYKYMVCTQCITYNHAPYILDTLNGFVLQKTTFPIVYCVIDDASTDGEPEVLRRWAKENLAPDVDGGPVAPKEMPYGELYFTSHKDCQDVHFAILLLSENHYQTGRDEQKYAYIDEWMRASKYHALCEGDDYWIVPDKLQMQVDFLEENEEYGMVHTDFDLVGGKRRNHYRSSKNDDGNWFPRIILEGLPVGTLTVIYRKETFEKTPHLYNGKNWPMGDKPLWYELAHEAKIKYIPRVTSCYRILTNSASHSSDINKVIAFKNAGVEIRLFYAQYYNIELNSDGFDKAYFRDVIKIAYCFGNLEVANQYLRLASEKHQLSVKALIFYLLAFVRFLLNGKKSV